MGQVGQLRRNVLLIAIASVALVVVVALFGPQLVLGAVSGLSSAEQAKFQNEVRGTLVSATAATLFLLTAFFGYLQVRLAQASQSIDLHAKAVAQFNSELADTRVAGLLWLRKAWEQNAIDPEELGPLLEAFIGRQTAAAGGAGALDGTALPLAVRSRDVHEALALFAAIRPLRNWSAITKIVEHEIMVEPQRRPVFQNTDLRGVDLRQANVQLWDLQQSNLASGNLARANLMAANLSGADLSFAQVAFGHFGQSFLILAKLDGVNLMNTNFTMAVLSGASLRKADLRGAGFAGAYLERLTLTPDWTDEQLLDLDPRSIEYSRRQVNQTISLLAHHGFFSSSLIARGPTYPPCDLRGADLRDADLSGAALLEANLLGAKANGGTLWPADYDPEAAGVIFE
ncbi:hypothetical protein GCM10018965_073410 [Nonomuraea roseola]